MAADVAEGGAGAIVEVVIAESHGTDDRRLHDRRRLWLEVAAWYAANPPNSGGGGGSSSNSGAESNRKALPSWIELRRKGLVEPVLGMDVLFGFSIRVPSAMDHLRSRTRRPVSILQYGSDIRVWARLEKNRATSKLGFGRR